MSLSVWQRNIVTEAGDVIPDAEIEVFDAGSSSKPDLFSDPDGNSSITNPFNADSNGFARFYVSGGRYDISVNGTVLWEDVALGTTQRRDTGPAPSEVPTNDDANARGFAQTVDSVSDLRTSTFPASLQRLWLSGYYGVGTAGGGPLYRDSDDTTTADNGGTVFVDEGGTRWKRSAENVSVTWFGAQNGASDNTDALNRAIEALNAGQVKSLIFPSGDFKVSETLSPILAQQSAIQGQGVSTRLQLESDTQSTIFQFGTDNDFSSRVSVKGLNLQVNDAESPSNNDACISFHNCRDMFVDTIYASRVRGLFSYGSATTQARRISVRDVRAVIDASSNADILRIENGTSIQLDNFNCSLSFANGDTDGSLRALVVKPENGNIVDTMLFSRVHIVLSGSSAETGVLFDSTNGNIVNGWFSDVIFDWTTQIGVHFLNNTTDGHQIREMEFTNARIAQGSGASVVFEADPGNEIVDIVFVGGTMNCRTVPSVQISGDEVKRWKFIGTLIRDVDSSGQTEAISVSDSEYWEIIGCHFGKVNPDFSATLTNAVSIKNDIDNFVIANNTADSLLNDFVGHAAYSSPSRNRVVSGNSNSGNSGANTQTVFVPAERMEQGDGNPSRVTYQTGAGLTDIRISAWEFVSGATNAALLQVPIPDNWSGDEISVKVAWLATTAGAGSVIMNTPTQTVSAGEDTSAKSLVSASRSVTTPEATDLLQVTSPQSVSLDGVGADTLVMKVARQGSSGGDTYSDAIQILGVYVEFPISSPVQ